MDYTDIPDPSEPPPPDEANSASEEDDGRSMRHRLQIASNLVTLLVAVSAIGLSVWEGCEARRHNRLAVLPNLDVNQRNLTVEAGGTVRIGGQPQEVDAQQYTRRVVIYNTGLGPAVVRKALVFPANALPESEPLAETQADGESISLYTVDSLMARLQEWSPRMGFFTGEFVQGAMLQAGNEWPFYEAVVPAASVPDSIRGLFAIRDMVAQYSFVICYCSVYGEDCDQEHIGADPPSNAVCDL